jgi:23S rRNA (cytidine1920-2'-O)/16S rRNA (cytidine1409-2'-O)-methyltransferase
MICLIKPQFEAGKELVEKGGVVRDKNTHIQVINNVLDCAKSLDYIVKGLTYSSIKGPAGNIEYLVWLATSGEGSEPDIREIVETAHRNLD